MRGQLDYQCAAHDDLADCPDSLVARGDFGYGLRVHDGGSSEVPIQFCPWRATKLQDS